MKKFLRDVVGPFLVLVLGFLVIVALTMALAGCGHNIVTYSDGIGFETTFRPDSGNFGFVLRYGKVISATVRENTLVEMVGEGKGGAEGSASGSASASGSVTIKTGRQVTGYTVDAIRARVEKDAVR